jgi:hypothetical protein
MIHLLPLSTLLLPSDLLHKIPLLIPLSLPSGSLREIPFELPLMIFNFLDNKTKLKLIKSNKYFHNNLYFDSFSSDVENVNLNKHYFLKLTRLNMHDNKLITNLNHLTNLTELDISQTNVTQEGIEKLTNLTGLNMHENNLIIDLNHLTALIELNMSDNILITDLNHLTALTVLNIARTRVNL